MLSSRLWLVLPRFVWSGRWFWAVWLLVFLLPFTRHEARLHFIGSRFFPRFYDQPWQERWMTAEDAPTPGLSPFERAVWVRVRGQNSDFSYYPGQNNDPTLTPAGRLLKDFPREGWLRALALSQSLSWNSLNKQVALIKWARAGERLDPQNAFYPLVLAKTFGDSGRKGERDAALERAAKGTRFDDGSWKLKSIALHAARKAGVATWSEEWNVWSTLNRNGNATVSQLDGLLSQCGNLSQQDVTVATLTKSPTRLRVALKRSNEMMRIALLLQSAPCDSIMWRQGAKWTRGAWRVARSGSLFWTFPDPTASEFTAFAKAQKSPPNVRLAQKCAARLKLLAPWLGPTVSMPLPTGAIFTPSERFWAEVGDPFGFGVLGFAAYLLGWWWLLSMFLWRTSGRESQRSARVVPASVVIGGTVVMFGVLTLLVMTWINAPTMARRGPPGGEAEVAVACGLFAFFAPPLLLALWCALRAQLKNRAALAFPARQQIEMNLSAFDGFVLTRATGVVALILLGLCVGLSVLWGVMRWQGLTGYDWLRFIWPGVSTRVVDPLFTSLTSPVVPLYSALCAITLAFVWLISWRYSAEPRKRPIFHDGLRAWKEALGCALTLTAWVYLALLVACHFSGNAFSKRLDVVAARGEGALVRGF